MKLRIALVLLPLVLFASDGNKADQTKKAETKPAPSAGITLPTGATSLGDGSWRYTDKDGKAWLYRQTPFGLARTADANKQSQADEIPAGMKATETGGEVRFERTSPFGPATWSRKKDQMTDVERRVWERDCVKGAAKGSSTGKE